MFTLEMWETSQSRVNTVTIKVSVPPQYIKRLSFVLAFE